MPLPNPAGIEVSKLLWDPLLFNRQSFSLLLDPPNSAPLLFLHSPAWLTFSTLMNKVVAVQKLNEQELQLGIAGTPASWHQQYVDSAIIYIGGLSKSATEQQILSIFEQYGTIVHVNLIRDAATGESKGFAFAQYVDPKSAVLAIDNLNGIELDGRTVRVDHVDNYRKKDDGSGMDTTPSGFNGATQSQVAHAVMSQQPDARGSSAPNAAEQRREQAVMQRLKALRKRRRNEHTTTPDNVTDVPSADRDAPPVAPPSTAVETPSPGLATLEPQPSNDKETRRQHRLEKEKRREERAAIREARSKRRAERQLKR